ncbi:hypothetical protein RIR_jg9161.t1 [Rhizophagus irregularis DAOM 181602=DAOM 197198]|nr:hypothetical protein RhiirB3_529142 [Rhizophagus irregularis]GET54594.1 hypothetical protein RIR_jg9161.t1 [Rhizophagus irregularis DAOM 181602=DAOM 197198]
MEQTENKEEFLGKEQMSEFMKGIFELKQEEIKDYEQEMMSLDTQLIWERNSIESAESQQLKDIWLEKKRNFNERIEKVKEKEDYLYRKARKISIKLAIEKGKRKSILNGRMKRNRTSSIREQTGKKTNNI